MAMFKNLCLKLFGKTPNPKAEALRSSGAVTIPRPVNGIEDLLPVLNATQLLKFHAALLTQINELAGVSEEAFQHFYLAAINGFARFIQQLPASEVHHHAGNGGLLTHSLEVCVLALRIRRSYLLSAQEGAESCAKKQDLWTYAVFLGALCHDLAKPAVTQRVDIYARPGADAVRWSPYGGFMDELGAYYRTAFVQGNVHHLHEKITPLLISRIIPKQGMQWLNSDPMIFAQWLAAITGDYSNADAIGTIVSQADGQSVSKNLGGGSPLAPTAKPKPVQEKILTSLRHLLASGRLPLNCQGGAAWVIGADCWLSSRLTGDTIREQLTGEGHRDTPALNGQLFDILQVHNVIIPCGDKALWQVTIVGEGWHNDTTALRIPVSKLWPHSASKPEDFTGDVQFYYDGVPVENNVGSVDAPLMEDVQPAVSLDVLSTSSGIDNAGESINDELSLDDYLPSMNTALQPEEIENNEKINAENSGKVTCPEQAVFSPKLNLPPVEFNPPATPKVKPVARQSESKQAEPKLGSGDASDGSEDFIAWLQSGIQQRLIPVNEANATIHVVVEGVLLASPGIFQRYAKAKDLQDWSSVQQSVLKKNWHIRNDKGLSFFKYQVVGKQKSATVNGILLPDAAFIFGSANIPKPNPHVTSI